MKLLPLVIFLAIGACSDQDIREPEVTEVPREASNNIPSDTSRVFYPNGQVQMEGLKRQGRREGEWKSYYQDGTPWSITHFRNGLRHGPTTVWYEDGTMRYQGNYHQDKPSGTWLFFGDKGEVIKEINYK